MKYRMQYKKSKKSARHDLRAKRRIELLNHFMSIGHSRKVAFKMAKLEGKEGVK